MNPEETRKLEYAIDMATLHLKEYKVLAFLAPALLMAVTVVIGVISGAWWQAILYILVLAVNYPKWKRNIVSTEAALHELNSCLLENRLDLSENAQKIYDSSLPSTGALWFGIISLAIISGACICDGAIVIKIAYDMVLDVPSLVVGLFLVGIGMLVSIPAIKWILMLPGARKYKESEY